MNKKLENNFEDFPKIMVEHEQNGVIYCITNTINDKSYIGQAKFYKQHHGKIINFKHKIRAIRRQCPKSAQIY